MTNTYHPSDPIYRAEEVTFDSKFDDSPVALWVGAAGNIVIKALDDSAARTWKAIPAGTRIDVVVDTIEATGTTVAAADILALYNRR